MSINSMELIACEEYGCPGCSLRHFHRTSDDSLLTEVPDVGMFTPASLAVLGRVALLTGAVPADEAVRTAPGGHPEDR